MYTHIKPRYHSFSNLWSNYYNVISRVPLSPTNKYDSRSTKSYIITPHTVSCGKRGPMNEVSLCGVPSRTDLSSRIEYMVVLGYLLWSTINPAYLPLFLSLFLSLIFQKVLSLEKFAQKDCPKSYDCLTIIPRYVNDQPDRVKRSRLPGTTKYGKREKNVSVRRISISPGEMSMYHQIAIWLVCWFYQIGRREKKKRNEKTREKREEERRDWCRTSSPR